MLSKFSLCVIIFVCGVFSILQNKIQLLPNTEPPQISFSVSWPGQNEAFLISDVVKPYEDIILSKIDNLESLIVTTEDEYASFEITFDFGADLAFEERKLASLLSQARSLPLHIKAPSFRRGGNNVSNRVVGSYFITSKYDEFSTEQLKFINDLAERKFKLLRDVEEVEINPLLEKQLKIKLDMDQLYQLGLSFELVRSSVLEILNQPVVRLYEGDNVVTTKFKQARSIEDLLTKPVAYHDGVAILLGDVAQVAIEPIVPSAVARYNGQQAIAMRILRDANANLVEVQSLVSEVLLSESASIQASGLEYNLSFDTAVFIERAIVWVLGSLLTGFILTLFVSYLFFRRLYPTLLAGLITLLSICCVFIVLNVTNTSINIISLAGITFATGMFVDGVLIFVEHLDRLSQEQKLTLGIINSSLNKLVPALVASSVTTVIVFVPVIFSSGAEGQLFRGLSLAIASGVIFSLLLTIMLTPLFALRFLSTQPSQSKAPLTPLIQLIQVLIAKKIRSKLTLFSIILLSLFCISWMLPSVSYLPSVKRDAVDVYIPIPPSKRIEAVNRDVVKPLNDVLQAIPEEFKLKNNYVIGWPYFVTAAIRLENPEQVSNLAKYIKGALANELPGQRVIVLQGELLGGVESSNDITVNLLVNDKVWLFNNLGKIREIFSSQLPGVVLRVTPIADEYVSEYEMIPNNAALRYLEVSDNELKNIVKALGQSEFIGKWYDNNEVLHSYITIKELDENYTNIPYVTSNGKRSYVGELVKIQSSEKLPSLRHIDGAQAVTLSLAITDKNLTVSDVMAKLEGSLLPEIKQLLGDKGFVKVEGSAASLAKAKLFIAVMLLFAITSLFLIVTVLFRSKKLSVYVLISLLPSLCGAILGYQLLGLFSDKDFNVLSMLGFVIMLGIVANNSILLVDAIQQHFVSAQVVSKAIIAGVKDRIRAIVISSLTTVLGMLPLLIFSSQASQIYQGIAAIIVGGITINLFTILLIIPAMVSLFGLSLKPNEK